MTSPSGQHRILGTEFTGLLKTSARPITDVSQDTVYQVTKDSVS